MKKILLLISVHAVIISAHAQITTIKEFYNTSLEGVKLLNNGRIIFQAKDTNNNYQVWSTDGTTAGTKALTNFCPTDFTAIFDPDSDTYSDGFMSDGNYYYGQVRIACGNNEKKIFKTDGNTITYSNQSNGTPGNYADWYGIHDSLNFGNKIYFFHLDKDIYTYDISTGNIDVVYGPGNPYPAANNDVRFINKDGHNLLLFFYNSGTNNSLVYFNTSSNTITDIFNFGQYYQNKTQYTYSNPNFQPHSTHIAGYSRNVIKWGGFTYFFMSYKNAQSQTLYALWKTDGTTAGTTEIMSFSYNSSVDLSFGVSFLPFNNHLYFKFSDKTRTGLWRTDGTSAGTEVIKAINNDTTYHNFNYSITNLVEMNGKIYFLGTSNSDDLELWESDGTTAGTYRKFDFVPGSSGIMDKNLVYHIIYKFNNRLFFTGSMFSAYKQIITTDGTIEGTYSLGGKYSSSRSAMVQRNDELIFSSSESSSKHYLHKLSLSTAKPLLLNHGTSATKGQSFTVTGHDLKNAFQVYLFDHNGTTYYYGQNLQQLNDTIVSFIIPASLPLVNFKVAIAADMGTFISQNNVTTSAMAIDEHKTKPFYSLSNTVDKYIITIEDITTEHHLTMFDINGRVLFQDKGYYSFEIEKEKYIPGIYFLKIDHKIEKIIIH